MTMLVTDAAASAPRTAPRSEPRTNVWVLATIFVTFALYGRSFGIIGELRYVEVAVLLAAVLALPRVIGSIDRLTAIFMGLFALTCLAHIVVNALYDVPLASTIKRVGTYGLLLVLIAAVTWISKLGRHALTAMVAGYCLSWVVIMFTGIEASPGYVLQPWRLGLGAAVTVAVCLIPLVWPRTVWIVFVALVLLVGIHVVLQARGMAMVTMAAAFFVGWSLLRARRWPRRLRFGQLFAWAIGGVLALTAVWSATAFAIEHRLFPRDLQIKMEGQFYSEYGIAASARPETVASIYAISKRPITGYGTSNADPDVLALYAVLASSSYWASQNFTRVLEGTLINSFAMEGTPSHSHVFGTWVDGGIFAALSWIAMLGLAAYVILRGAGWRHPLMPLAVTVSLFVLWYILFSPGPHRMEVAIHLVILIRAATMIRMADREERRIELWRRHGMAAPLPAR